MTFFIAPSGAVTIAQLTHADDIRRAEQSRLAKELRDARRAQSTGETQTGIKRARALFGSRHPVH